MDTPNKRRIVAAPSIDDYIVTIELGGSDQNYSANYWVTSMYDSDIQLVLNVNTPIFAYDIDMAFRVATHNVDSVLNLAKLIGEPNANLNTTPPTNELREQHAYIQMARYGTSGKFADLTLSERTNAQVTLCQQFGVKNLAKLIASYENVNIRTIHERIQRLRKDSFA
jgi:hypothetical protein